jgi:hypothetical protein
MWVRKKALRCWKCGANLKTSNIDSETIEFIDKGIAIMEKEFMEIEYEINIMTEGHFRRHMYTEEELINSQHIDKIRAIAAKLGRNVGNLEAKGILSKIVRDYYENNIAILKQKLAYIYNKIKSRRKNGWDCTRDILLSSYYFIFNIAFYHFKTFGIPGLNDSGKSSNIFNIFGNATQEFENFVYNDGNRSNKDNYRAEEARYTEAKQSV